MNFDDMKDAWVEQTPFSLSGKKDEITRLVRSRSEALGKKGYRIFAAALLVGSFSTIWVIACSILFFSMDTMFLKDLGIVPLPSMVLAPAYISVLCLSLIFNYKRQIKMNKAHEDTLRGFAQTALAQTINQIRLLRITPFALVCLWVVVAISAFAIPGIRAAIGDAVPLAILISVMDLLIITAIFWWTGRRIRLKHLPRKSELESIIASL